MLNKICNCRCMAVRCWPIMGLLDFNLAALNGFGWILSLKKERNRLEKHIISFIFFIKTRIIILLYFVCMALTYKRLAEIEATSKRGRKCNTLRCTSCHCVVTRGLKGCGRSNTPSTLVASHRSCNRQMVASKSTCNGVLWTFCF